MKLCNMPNCGQGVFSKGKCKFHQKRRPLKRSSLKQKVIKKQTKKVKTNQVHEFFKQIWLERPHVSEISQEKLGSVINSMYFHHIILKSDKKYGELGKYDTENIVLLTPQEHANVHIDMYRYEKINKKREYLLNKYQKILDEKKKD